MRIVRLVVVNVAVLAVLFALVEGLSSLALFVHTTTFHGVMAERQTSAYDAELGWVALPNLRLRDFYRPGATLSTNNLGFRGTTDLDPAAPAARTRIICSGDSFTLGYGVDDEETWCRDSRARIRRSRP